MLELKEQTYHKQTVMLFIKECKLKGKEAKEFRAKGAEMVEITANADKEVTVILANAEKSSQILKGEGDGKRNKIFCRCLW